MNDKAMAYNDSLNTYFSLVTGKNVCALNIERYLKYAELKCREQDNEPLEQR